MPEPSIVTSMCLKVLSLLNVKMAHIFTDVFPQTVSIFPDASQGHCSMKVGTTNRLAR